MVYLLIDNCSLRDLIDIHGYSSYLTELEELIVTKRVCFITHNVVIEEWEKHKASWLKQKGKKLLGENNTSVSSDSLLPSTNLVTNNHLEEQVRQIDYFLNQATHILNTPQIISNEFSERYKKGLAPFHKKKNSQNDWEIIGSYCHFCEINAISEAYFLSSNHTDFGDENCNFLSIHPDFKNRFSTTIIHYYKNFTDLFKELRNINGIPISIIPYKIIPNKKYSFKATIKKTVLESLVFLYTQLYSEIDFIPTHILIEYYPFSESENSETHYNHFTVSCTPDILTDFFENVVIDDNKNISFKDESLLSSINNYQEKVEQVLRNLTTNLVFHLKSKKNRKIVCTHYYNHPKCDCFQCSYSRFQFQKTFTDLRNNVDDYKEKLKQAYIHYQVGNYKSANDIYEGIIQTALTDKKFITYFIAKYNQKQLSRFLGSYFLNKQVDNDVIKYLTAIDPLEEAVKLKSHTDYNLLSFIAQEDYFTEAFQKIREATNNILEHYYSQLRGGYSFNQHIWDLMEGFAKLESFINCNYIIYDQYSNFDKLFENVVEGLFASHAMSNSQPDRLQSFDDYWVGKFLVYGNRKSIIKLFDRFHLTELKYQSTTKEGDSFIELVKNLLESIEYRQNFIVEFADVNNDFFDSRVFELFDNALTMAAILDLKKTVLNDFCNLVVKFLSRYSISNYSSLQALQYFIENKGQLLSLKHKYALLNFSLKNQLQCHQNLLIPTLESFDNDSLKKLSTKDFNLILKEIFEKCPKCESTHGYGSIGCLYIKVPKEKKSIIRSAVLKKLKEKFDFELFYLSSIFEIIEFDLQKTLHLIKEFKLDVNQKKRRSIFSRSDFNQNSYLDRIANLCFKYDVNTTSKEFLKLKKVDLYYEWLFDMEKFDYTKFNPEWVFVYQTKYYQKAMSKSSQLIKELRKILSDKFHIGLERILLRITNFTEIKVSKQN